MRRKLSIDLQACAADQAGVVSRRQLRADNLSDHAIQARLDAHRWQRLHPGVYAVFSGPVPRWAHIWAGLLVAGPAAVLSHQTAAEIWGIADHPERDVHVSVPIQYRVRSRPGVVVHRTTRLTGSPRPSATQDPFAAGLVTGMKSPSASIGDLRTGTISTDGAMSRSARHPTATPPRTRVEVTVIDLAEVAGSVTQVVAWVTRACQRRLTTPDRLRMEAAGRARLRWRTQILGLLADVAEGAETPLEIAYLQKVERAHGLPPAHRQRHEYVGGLSQWIDADYVEYGVRAELDGRLGHVEEGRFRDHVRDNASAENGHVTLRYGWGSVHDESCGVAAQVARQLVRRGWAGRPRACGATCRAGQAEAA